MKPKVILRQCEDYSSPDRISTIIHEGAQELNLKPFGKTLVKPNLVFAHHRYGKHAYTNPAVLEGLFHYLRDCSTIKEISLGERSAITMPTRYLYQVAGYNRFRKQFGIKMVCLDEEPKRAVELKKATVHKEIKVPVPVLDADFKVWVPKLKNHVSAKMTCTLKLNIGILDSSERLIHHDYFLEDKIADLLEPGNPDFIVVDAIEGGERNELVPRPVKIGALIMGTNAVAVDSVCARIIGLEPQDIKHLMLAHQRGYGPISLDDIDITGDISLEKLIQKGSLIDRSYNDVNTMNTPIRVLEGPWQHGKGLCKGGCLNTIKAVLALVEAARPGSIEKAYPISVVIGKYQGDLDGKNHKIILLGDCSEVEGKIINGKTIRVKGCPVPAPFLTLYACYYGGMPSPYLDPAAMLPLPFYTSLSFMNKWFKNFKQLFK